MIPPLTDRFTPTSSLPTLARLRTYNSTHLSNALNGLRNLYWPTNTISTDIINTQDFVIRRALNHATTEKRRDMEEFVDSGYASAEEDFDDGEEEDGEGEDVDGLRADPMEKEYAVRWLTGFIARSDSWASEEDTDARYELVEEASLILSSFTATDSPEEPAEVALSRTFTFSSPGTPSGSIDVKLNDEPLSEEDHTSVGLQSWASSIMLAQKMSSDPCRFGLDPSSDKTTRILELGAGTGLLSIIATKLLGNADSTHIVATDYHPDVLRNLQVNIDINSCTPFVDVQPLDWEAPDYSLLGTPHFDIILAADVIYHPDHATWIKRCVEQLLTPDGCFWLAIPVRNTGRHEGLNRTVDEIFGCGVKGGVGILEEEVMEKQAGLGRADESEYRLFKLGWV